MLPPSDSNDPEVFAAEAEKDRRETVLGSNAHAWRDIPLQAWNGGRQREFARIAALDLPGGNLEDLEQLRQRFEALKAQEASEIAAKGGVPSDLTFAEVVDYDLYLPAATKVLYLAAVPRGQWFHLRAHPARLLDAIEAWGEENIAVHDVPEACELARQILTEHRKLVPQLRVQGGTGAAPGN